MNKCLRIVFYLLLLLPVKAITQPANPDGPRYLLFNAGVNFMDPKQLTAQQLINFRDHFKVKNAREVQPGINVIISYLQYDINTIKRNLRLLLSAVEKADLPVMIKLDGEQWWQAKPELWNWWDPAKPGYNVENMKNVEWTSWEEKSALKLAWRNWGRQLRVLPPPNLMSSAYKDACTKAMNNLLPVIMNWWQSLPAAKKHLFAGITVGWESSIGVNAFYYPNGNSLFDKPEKDDPQYGIVRADVLSRGVVQIGYAAVKTAGIRSEGDITEEDLVEVVRRHLEALSKQVYDAGFPRDKIFAHGWGNEFGEKMYDAPVNKYASPGWSNYWTPDDVSKNPGIMRNIKKSDAKYWSMAEWLIFDSRDEERWEKAIRKTLFHPGCKSIIIYNWDSIKESPQVIAAINRVLLTPPN